VLNRPGKILLKNLYYYSDRIVKKGFVYVEEHLVKDAGEEALPEYELSDVVYDFNNHAYAVHGFSMVLKGVEQPFRGISHSDLSIYTESELEKIALHVFTVYYSLGITLPIIETDHPGIVNKVAKEHGLQLVLVHDRGVIPHYGSLFYIERDGERLYYQDSFIGFENKVFCKPEKLDEGCIAIDARSVDLPHPSVISALGRIDFERLLEALSKPYRFLGLDNGCVDKGSRSDILVYDLRSPLKQQPLMPEILFKTPFKNLQPDLVIVKGDFAFEYGEILTVSLPRVIFK
jgi:hypothetical protein